MIRSCRSSTAVVLAIEQIVEQRGETIRNRNNDLRVDEDETNLTEKRRELFPRREAALSFGIEYAYMFTYT